MKKIMFNDRYGLTEAVLNGKKTQTRRVINVPDGCEIKVLDMPDGDKVSVLVNPSNGKHGMIDGVPVFGFVKVLEPKYFIGEVVAVAMSYDDIYMEKIAPCEEKYRWNAYNKGWNHKHKGWKNKMFVSAEDMPHHIRITNIRIESLQDISEEDCLAEGIEKIGSFYHFKDTKNDEWEHYAKPRSAFSALIDKVSGKGTLDGNPYVFVYEFETVTKHALFKVKKS